METKLGKCPYCDWDADTMGTTVHECKGAPTPGPAKLVVIPILRMPGHFRIKQATNYLEHLPNQTIDKATVEKLIASGATVVIASK